MNKEQFNNRCQSCGAELRVAKLECPSCGLKIEGSMELPRLARLSAEDRHFVELFVLSGGSLKELCKMLEVSYPTVRARLDKVIAALRALDVVKQDHRKEILDALNRHEITADEAVRRLSREE
jgi:hypothetical protein